ncbi:MAG TPA: RecX family transcriptional regulator [Dehalococcoidia bacterium]|nr:RecX family transcriptional regulator [Dehalococcoidia bacterium]
MLVTAIERQQRRRRANVFLDGQFAIALSLDVIAEGGLHQGSDLSQAELDSLRERDARQQALAAGIRLLAYRPRSVAELRSRLTARRFGATIIDETIARLRKLSLLDDAAFARSWVESRERSSPRGKRMLQFELRQKGVTQPLAAEAVATIDEGEAAYRAAERRARTAVVEDFETFRRRIGDFLRRRGFSYGTIEPVLRRLWQERGE